MASHLPTVLTVRRECDKMSWRQNVRALVFGVGVLISLAAYVLPCAVPVAAAAQSPQTSSVQGTGAAKPAQPIAGVSAGARPQSSQATGSIVGTIIDQSGAVAVGAQVQLTPAGQAQTRQVLSGNNGEFSFADLPPGPFHLRITASGFQTKVFSGSLHPGEAYIVPEIVLSIASSTTNVRVGVTPEEAAQVEIKEEEQQRVLGFIPNFYVSYVPNAAPLSAKQKFQLAWKSSVDPITFLGVGALAGVEQATDDFKGYGQGAQGYAKRFGAGYGDVFIGTFLDSAILPSLFRQDPRYFYQGTGTTRSRLLHALSNAVIRKGDKGRWQPNYSAIIGSFATSAISYTYYPAADRGGGLLVQNALISIAGGGVAGVFQEFVLRKFTSRAKKQPAAQP